MKHARQITLTDDERRTLNRWTRGRRTPARLVLRAKIVLLAADGMMNKDIAELTSKEVIRQNKKDFEKIGQYNMHIDTNLIRCKKNLFDDGKGKKLLYIGFGEGHNLAYFLKEGFKCYGTEISKNHVDYVNKRLKGKARLRLVDSNILPYKDNFFDVVVAWQSLYYNNERSLREALYEIQRVLKPGGCFLSSMVSGEMLIGRHSL